MGLPFLTGFYSKDVIIEVSSLSLNISTLMSLYLATLSVFGTAYYSTRLLIFVFFNNTMIMVNPKIIKESNYFTLFVLMLLAVLSLFVGYLFKDFFLYNNSDI